MIWKKNVFSYLIWLLYTIMTGFALLCLGTAFCGDLDINVRFGAVFAAVMVAVPGTAAFVLRRIAPGCEAFFQKNKNVRAVTEAALAAVFLTVGLVLRLTGIGDAGEAAAYYETAKVTMGQEIPQIAHGAVYFYVQLLHGIFVLLGNRFVLGIVLQIVLQYIAALVLFFVLRKLTGSVSALLVLAFLMCAPYMVRCGLTLSPEILYFCLLSVALALIAAGYAGRLKAFLFVLTGIVIAVMAYTDVAGLLLVIMAFAVIFCVRREPVLFRTRAGACLCCLLGLVFGFVSCIFVDSVISQKSFEGVWNVWFLMYRPEAFQIPVTVGILDSRMESLALLCMMALGVFSFWFQKREERLVPCMLAACAVILGSCFGIFTKELPGNIYLYLLFALMAGIGLEQCFAGGKSVKETAETAARSAETKQSFDKEEPEENSGLPGGSEAAAPAGKKEVKYIENPLPLPKKHVKKVLDYDYPVSDDDDFDI